MIHISGVNVESKVRLGRIILGHPRPSWNMLLKHSPCSYCGKTTEPHKMTIDHIRPRAKWLTKKLREAWIKLYSDYGDMNYNTTSACQDCNNAKQTTELLHFMLERLVVE